MSFDSGKLLLLAERNYTCANIMYTDGKEYSVLNVAALIELGMTDHRKVMVKGFGGDEVECYEFKYEKGEVIHPTGEVPKSVALLYPYVRHHILMGKSIPYLTDDDIDTLLDSIPRFCGIGLPEYGYTNHFTEMIQRCPNDLQVPKRLSKAKGVAVIPFSSVVLNVSSIIGKNRGGYLEDGLMSASVTTSEASTTFEKIQRA